jgi:hypothetical protein
MIPDAYLSHQSFRRLRIKVPSKRADKPYFIHACEQFEKFPGIETLEINDVTGSILFIHSVDIESIKRYAEENKLFLLKNDASIPLFNRISSQFSTLDEKVKKVTGKELNITSIVVIALVVHAIIQIRKGNLRAVPWDAAIWYALNIFWKKPAR